MKTSWLWFSRCAQLVLSVFFVSAANAAAPLDSQSSTQLSLVNVNATGAAVQNTTLLDGSTRVSVGPPFTPGSEPAEDPFFYDVPFTNPHMTLKLRDFLLDPKRDESDVDQCFRQAVRECSDRRKHDTDIPQDEDTFWGRGASFLRVRPRHGDHDQYQNLTYGIFVNVLQGVNNFRLFYPHLNFIFEIYLDPGGEEELYVGRGQLDVYQGGQHTTAAR